MNPSPAKVLIADDHEAVRRGVRQLVEQIGDAAISEASDGEMAVQIALAKRPDLLILDFSLPVINGLHVTKQVSAGSPETEILLFTMHDKEEIQLELLRAGARGYVLKSDPAETLIAAIQALLRHKPYFTPSVSQTLLDSFLKNATRTKPTLTDREHEIVQLVAEGMTSRQVAEALRISVKTVETHRSAILSKLRANSTADIVRYAIRNGIIEA